MEIPAEREVGRPVLAVSIRSSRKSKANARQGQGQLRVIYIRFSNP